MSLDYLNEAFKRLDLLNEETFRSDSDGINKLNDFVEDDDNMDVVKVIDSDAEDEDDLKDSYVGKVIIDCNVCGSHIFKDKENIHVNEDGCVNCDEECPYCGETSGFTIVGEICKYSTEDVQDSLTNEPEEPELEEGLGSLVGGAALAGAAGAVASGITGGLVGGAIDRMNEEAEVSIKDQIRDILAKNGYDVDREGCKECISAAATLLSYSDNPDVESWYNDTIENYPEELEEFKKVEEGLGSLVGGAALAGAAGGAISGLVGGAIKNMTESVEEVSIETEDQSIKVEDDKITIEKSEDRSEENESEEVIVPVSDETVKNLEGITDEDTEEDEEIVDTEIEDVDEKEFDKLGESYLKSVYENVKSFKTTGARKKNNSIVLEGYIKFKSGVEKKTGFIFEALETDKSGAFKFNGLNKHFSNDPSAFTLIGKVKNKKLIPESLAYNYTVKNQLIRGVARKAR